MGARFNNRTGKACGRRHFNQDGSCKTVQHGCQRNRWNYDLHRYPCKEMMPVVFAALTIIAAAAGDSGWSIGAGGTVDGTNAECCNAPIAVRVRDERNRR
jgi:hypothetical protein